MIRKNAIKTSFDELTSISSNNDSQILVSGNSKGQIFINSLLKNGLERNTITFQIANSAINDIIWMDKGTIIVATNLTEILMLDLFKESIEKLEGHSKSIKTLTKLDENIFFSGGRDSKILKWDLRENKNVLINCKSRNEKLDQSITSIALNSKNNNKLYCSHTFPSSVDFFDLRYSHYGKYKEEKCLKTKNNILSFLHDESSYFLYSLDINNNIIKISDDCEKKQDLKKNNNLKSSFADSCYSKTFDLKIFTHKSSVTLVDRFDNTNVLDVKGCNGSVITRNNLFTCTENGEIVNYEIKENREYLENLE